MSRKKTAFDFFYEKSEAVFEITIISITVRLNPHPTRLL